MPAHNLLLPALIQLFSEKGMASKKSEGRVASRNALLFIKANLIKPLSVTTTTTTIITSDAISTDRATTSTDTSTAVAAEEEEFIKLVESSIGKEKAQYVFADLKKRQPLALQPSGKMKFDKSRNNAYNANENDVTSSNNHETSI
jgi:hypothetical protein